VSFCLLFPNEEAAVKATSKHPRMSSKGASKLPKGGALAASNEGRLARRGSTAVVEDSRPARRGSSDCANTQ
jgi:hypothetical protein